MSNVEGLLVVIPLIGIVAFILVLPSFRAGSRGHEKLTLPTWFVTSTKSQAPRSEEELARDKAAREEARSAAIMRAEKSVLSRKKKNKKVKKGDFPGYLEKEKISTFGNHGKPLSKTDFCRPAGAKSTQGTAGKQGILAEEGVTRYYCIPGLLHADEVARMLKQIAREFAPIIKRRGYQVYSVSEMCCCGDGLDMNELGGHLKRVKDGAKIAGHEQHECGGYNRTRFTGKSKTRHTIHLRVRLVQNHNVIIPYGMVVNTMCHELAHCVHHGGHPPAFYDLMEEIKQEYQSVVMGKHRQQYGSTSEFDIYSSTMAQCWK